MSRSARRRGMLVGAMVGSSIANKKNAAAAAAAAPPDAPSAAPPVDAPAGDGVAGEIKKLGELRDQGLITEEEFTAKKKQLLGI